MAVELQCDEVRYAADFDRQSVACGDLTSAVRISKLMLAMLLRNGGPGGTKRRGSEQVFRRRRNAQAGNIRTPISRAAVKSAYEAGVTATRVCVLSMLS